MTKIFNILVTCFHCGCNRNICHDHDNNERKTKRQNLKCYYLSFLDQTTIGSEGTKEEKYINL